MATFNVVVSDPETGQSYTREVDGQDANRFMGREIGEEVDGTAVGLDGFTLEIRGGSDDAGRPMRDDVRGPALKEILLEGGVGYKPNRDGERKRVTVRGREVSDSIAQLNVAVVEGEGSVPVALGEEEPPEEEEADAEEAEAEASEAAEEAEEPEADVDDEDEPEEEEADEAEEEESAEEAAEEEADESGEEEEADEADEEEAEDEDAPEEDADAEEDEESEEDAADEDEEADDAEESVDDTEETADDDSDEDEE